MTKGYTDAPAPLTPRMRAVLASAAAGHTAAQTAADLGVAVSTVRSIRAAVYVRLEVHTITAAVAVAAKRGELPA